MGECISSYIPMSDYDWYLITAIATNFLQCISPLPTFVRIIKRKSIGGFLSLPCAVSLADLAFAIWYDLSVASPKDESTS